MYNLSSVNQQETRKDIMYEQKPVCNIEHSCQSVLDVYSKDTFNLRKTNINKPMDGLIRKDYSFCNEMKKTEKEQFSRGEELIQENQIRPGKTKVSSHSSYEPEVVMSTVDKIHLINPENDEIHFTRIQDEFEKPITIINAVQSQSLKSNKKYLPPIQREQKSHSNCTLQNSNFECGIQGLGDKEFNVDNDRRRANPYVQYQSDKEKLQEKRYDQNNVISDERRYKQIGINAFLPGSKIPSRNKMYSRIDNYSQIGIPISNLHGNENKLLSNNSYLEMKGTEDSNKDSVVIQEWSRITKNSHSKNDIKSQALKKIKDIISDFHEIAKLVKRKLCEQEEEMNNSILMKLSSSLTMIENMLGEECNSKDDGTFKKMEITMDSLTPPQILRNNITSHTNKDSDAQDKRLHDVSVQTVHEIHKCERQIQTEDIRINKEDKKPTLCLAASVFVLADIQNSKAKRKPYRKNKKVYFTKYRPHRVRLSSNQKQSGNDSQLWNKHGHLTSEINDNHCFRFNAVLPHFTWQPSESHRKKECKKISNRAICQKVNTLGKKCRNQIYLPNDHCWSGQRQNYNFEENRCGDGEIKLKYTSMLDGCIPSSGEEANKSFDPSYNGLHCLAKRRKLTHIKSHAAASTMPFNTTHTLFETCKTSSESSIPAINCQKFSYKAPLFTQSEHKEPRDPSTFNDHSNLSKALPTVITNDYLSANDSSSTIKTASMLMSDENCKFLFKGNSLKNDKTTFICTKPLAKKMKITPTQLSNYKSEQPQNTCSTNETSITDVDSCSDIDALLSHTKSKSINSFEATKNEQDVKLEKIMQLKMPVISDGLEDAEIIIYYSRNGEKCDSTSLTERQVELSETITSFKDVLKYIFRSVFAHSANYVERNTAQNSTAVHDGHSNNNTLTGACKSLSYIH